MLNPNIGKLIEHYPNRYRLVIDLSRAARTVSQTAERNEEILIEKPVSIAIDKLSSDIKND